MATLSKANSVLPLIKISSTQLAVAPFKSEFYCAKAGMNVCTALLPRRYWIEVGASQKW
jgi:hypothetical protein